MSENLILLGDFNAHSPLWGYDTDDEKGIQLNNHMSTHHLISANNPNSLATFETQRSKGWPDISLLSFPIFSRLLTWDVLEEMDYGNHRLVTIEMDIEIPELPRRRYRTQNTSFKKFNRLLTTYIMQENIEFHNIMTTNEFDMMYQKFLKQIHKACNASLKKKKSTYRPKITWWTQDLRRARNYTRALRRKTKLTIATEADF